MNSKTYLQEPKPKYGNWLLFVSVILIGLNLRAPLTAIGSLIMFIRDDLGISNALAGTITTLPLLAFALLSPFVPNITRRIGMAWAIFICLFVLSIGIIIRSLPGVSLLFIGTILIGLAIAIGNVLLPALIKINFPLKIGLMTGLYAVSMNLFGALASGISVPLAEMNALGWRGALGATVILSGTAVFLWLPQLRKKEKREHTNESTQKKSKNKSIWLSPLAWQVTIFMGFQSLLFYTFVTWLPEILQFHGYSTVSSGWMLSLLQFSVIPITFIIPIIAEKVPTQSILSGITATLFFIGICILMIGHTVLIPVAVIIIGIAVGSSFGLAMMFFTLRTEDGQQAAELSGMAQSVGYLFAAGGPVLFGAIHDITMNWSAPLIMLLIISVVLFIAGIGAGKDRVITSQ